MFTRASNPPAGCTRRLKTRSGQDRAADWIETSSLRALAAFITANNMGLPSPGSTSFRAWFSEQFTAHILRRLREELAPDRRLISSN